jgi:hypothetical protein
VALKMRFSFALLLCLSMLTSAMAAEEKAYRPPRGPDGKPDLQGMWMHSTGTPLERPKSVKTLVISPVQAREIEISMVAVGEDRTIPTEPTEYFNERHIERIHGELHSSMIVDPADGHIPGTALFNERAPPMRANSINSSNDGPEQRPTSERCLGNPASQPPILWVPGNNLHKIVQTPDTIMFMSETMNDARVIRIRAKHAPAVVTSWLGDSIGWWEGDTLVVETKYFTPSDTARMAPFITFIVSPQTTVTERFTRVARNEINYVFTVGDPLYYTRPWTGETHFLSTDEHMLEYACHEGNYSLVHILEGARVRDGQYPPMKQ